MITFTAYPQYGNIQVSSKYFEGVVHMLYIPSEYLQHKEEITSIALNCLEDNKKHFKEQFKFLLNTMDKKDAIMEIKSRINKTLRYYIRYNCIEYLL